MAPEVGGSSPLAHPIFKNSYTKEGIIIVRKYLIPAIVCLISILSNNAFAGITEDIDTAKNDVAYDYGLISNWTSQEFSEGVVNK